MLPRPPVPIRRPPPARSPAPPGPGVTSELGRRGHWNLPASGPRRRPLARAGCWPGLHITRRPPLAAGPHSSKGNGLRSESYQLRAAKLKTSLRLRLGWLASKIRRGPHSSARKPRVDLGIRRACSRGGLANVRSHSGRLSGSTRVLRSRRGEVCRAMRRAPFFRSQKLSKQGHQIFVSPS